MTPTNPTISPFTQLSVESLSFSYHSTPALQNLSFSAHPGELIAIVGPNGCGKSTLLKLLIGALTPTAGTISIDHKPLPQWSRIDIARRLALVPQVGTDTDSASSFGDAGFTVRQSVMMARYAAHVDAAPRFLQAAAGIGIFAFESPLDQQLATTALWNFDVHHLIDRHLNTLSGGERQRVALARALAQQTPILLLDEPTSALDLFHQLELLHHLQTLTSHGTLALLITHDLNLALTHASRVLLLDRGTLIADGPPQKVLTPQTLQPIYHVQVTQQGPTLLFHRQPP